jgi:hypothetical protein
VDSLFRSSQSNGLADEAQRSEIGLIFAHSLRERQLSAPDKTYAADIVVAHTGITRPEAEKRVR